MVCDCLESPQNLNDFAPENLNLVKHLDFAIFTTDSKRQLFKKNCAYTKRWQKLKKKQ
jgi:hypothetical protein